MPTEPYPRRLIMRYENLPTGNFYRIAAKPEAGEFFKCQP